MSAFGGKLSGKRLERAQGSSRFAGGTFHNTRPVSPGLRKGSTLPTMAEFFFGGQRRTPVAPLPSINPLEAWSRPADTDLRATWLGHSTVLVEIDGAKVLTDPVWGERASPTSIAGPKRFQPVPITMQSLPPLDAVVISHDHYDHLDYASILALAPTGVPFVTSLGVGAHLETWGVPATQIIELDWWESIELAPHGITITAAPSQHFSGRRLGDRNATLWSSMAIRGPRHSVFFSGDTGLTPEYVEIRKRLGPFDLIMLEVGAFHPSWGDIHLGPDNALTALGELGGGAFLPVHWGTFNLGIHAWDEPAETLISLAPGRADHLLMPRIGEAIEPAHTERVDPWWRPTAELETKSRACAPKREVETRSPVPEETMTWPID